MRTIDRQRLLPLGAGLALLGSLAIALSSSGSTAAALALAAVGTAAALVVLAPPALRAIVRYRSMLGVVVIAILAVIWVVSGLIHVGGSWGLQSTVPNGTPYPPFGFFPGVMQSEWPWRIGRLSLGALAVELLAAGGGMVLIADAVRVQAGLAGPPRSAWHALTGQRRRSGRVASRAIPGIGLIAVAAFLGITLATRYVAGHELLETVAVLGIAGSATVLVASPLAVGLLMRTDLDKAGRAREEERRRFAAHLHDSVLQTLALIQRQAHDPAAVTKLARRQEHALRAWMAGEADLVSATVATAVREMVAEVEDEEGVTVELTSIGADRGLDSKDEELIAAGREALRNAARHAPGASIFVFLDIDRERTEMFIRDDGPGFDPGAVAAERRGLRDAVLGRMRFVGGLAVVDSAPGQGTEIALRLPHNGRVR